MAKEEDPTHDERRRRGRCRDNDPRGTKKKSEKKEETKRGNHVHAHAPKEQGNVEREKKKDTNHHESNGPDEGCASTRRTRETARRNDGKGTWSWTEA